MIITILLLSGEELIAELIESLGDRLRVKKPLRVECTEIGDRVVTRLNTFMLLNDGDETMIYMRHVVATSKSAQKVVDYYTKAVDKWYNDSFTEAPGIDEKTGAGYGITDEEILSLISGRIKIQ